MPTDSPWIARALIGLEQHVLGRDPGHGTQNNSKSLAPHVLAVAVAPEGLLGILALARHLRRHGPNDAPAALLHRHRDRNGFELGMLERLHVIKDCRGDGGYLCQPPLVVKPGKVGQAHELSGDGDGSRAQDEGRAPLRDAGVEEDENLLMQLGALLAPGQSACGFGKIAFAGLAAEALKTSIFEIFAGKPAFSDNVRGMTAMRAGHGKDLHGSQHFGVGAGR